MADNNTSGTGFELDVNVSSFLEEIGKAERALDSLAVKADKTTEDINKAFSDSNITNVNSFVKKITEASGALEKMLNPSEESTKALSDIGDKALDAANKINELNDALNDNSDSNKNKDKGKDEFNAESLKQYTEEVKKAKKAFTDTGDVENYTQKLNEISLKYQNIEKNATLLGQSVKNVNKLSTESISQLSSGKNVSFNTENEVKQAKRLQEELLKSGKIKAENVRETEKSIMVYDAILKGLKKRRTYESSINKTIKERAEITIPDFTKNLKEDSISAINDKLKAYSSLLKKIPQDTQSLNEVKTYSEITDEISRLNAKKEEEIQYQKEFNTLAKEEAANNEKARLNKVALVESQQEYNKIGVRSIEIEQLRAKYSKEEEQSKRDSAAATKAKNLADKESAALKKKLIAKEKEQAKAEKATKTALLAYDKAMLMADNTTAARTRKISAIIIATKKLRDTEGDHTVQVKRAAEAVKKLYRANQSAATTQKSLTNNIKKTNSSLGELTKLATAYFSIRKVYNFLSELVKVRGEFELQQRALQAIIQDKYAANKIFSQIAELSVRSPFRLKNLVTYTKQLAAYRIETSKLFDTTKQLADVSAGLGVDMDRLILAYGQVKAANYLRGTELRQFSEAGINILGELSDKFSEVEGRAVSVGEVFEMVSKRMVSFQDVADVFDSLTQRGGMFYNMQEIQANTIQGMLTNIKDAVDIAYNDIGKANDGVIKKTIELVRYLVLNWEKVADVMRPAITSYLTYQTLSKGILAFEKARTILLGEQKVATVANTVAIKGETVAQKEFNLVAKANPYIIAATVLAAGAYAVYEIIQNNTKQQREFNKAVENGIYSSNKLAGNFETLANKAIDAADGSDKQKDALKELRRTYKEILPAEYLKIDALKNMRGEYDNVTASIYSYINAKTQEEMISSANDMLRKELASSQSDLVDELVSQGVKQVAAQNIVQNAIADELASSEAHSAEMFKKNIEEITLKSENIKVTLDEYKRVKLTSAGEKTAQYANILAPVDEVENVLSTLERYKNTIKEVQATKISPIVDFKQKELKENLDSVIETADNEIKKTIKEKGWSERFNPFQIFMLRKDVTTKAITDFTDGLKESMKTASDTEKIYYNNIINSANKTLTQFNTGEVKDEINDLVLSMTDANKNLTRNDVFKYIIDGSKTVSDYSKDVEASFKELDNIFSKVPTFADVSKNSIFSKNNNIATEEQYNKLKGIYEILTRIRGELSYEKTTTSTSKGTNDVYKERVSLLVEMNTAYEKLLKTQSSSDAKQSVLSTYGKRASQSGLSIDSSTNFDKAGTIASLAGLTANRSIDSINKAISKLEFSINVGISKDTENKLKSQLDKAFSDFSISSDLDSTNIPADLQERFFGITPTSLKQLRETVESYRDKFVGTDGIKEYESYLKKLEDLEKKSVTERAKNYIKYLTETLSEREQIETKYNDLLSQINESNELTDSEKNLAAYRINAEKRKEIAKSSYEEFKNSFDYQVVFDDMSNIATSSLQRVKNNLTSLMESSNGDLEPTDLKAIIEGISKLDDVINSRNPFKAISDGIKEYNKAMKATKVAQNDYDKALEDNLEKSNAVDKAQKKLKDTIAKYGKNSKEAKDAEDEYNDTRLDSAKSTDKLKVAHDKLEEAFKDGGKSADKIIGGIEGIQTYAASAAESVTGLMSAFGASDEAVQDVQNVMDGLDGMGDMASGIANIASGNIMAGITQTAKGLAKVATSITKIHDSKYEKEIVKQQKLVDKLVDKYEDLGKAIDKAYDFEDLSENYEDKKETLMQENESYEKMIAAEKKKKKTDSEQIQEWQDKIKENNEALEELEQERIEKFGGTDVQSAAQDFADAWFDAINSTENALDALSDSFDDILKNLVLKQATLKVAEKYVKPLVDKISDAVDPDKEGGENVTANEMNVLKGMRETTIDGIDNYFDAILQTMGLKKDSFASASSNLSTLQQGITGVTENTAGVIESYMNSLRYFATERNSYLRDIKAVIEGQYGSGDDNPMLTEVKAIRSLVNQINSSLNDVVKNTSMDGGKGIKVFMS